MDPLPLDPSRQDSEGETALHGADRFGHAEVVRLLLGAPGAKIRLKNSRGLDALELAVDYGKPEVADMIRQALSKL